MLCGAPSPLPLSPPPSPPLRDEEISGGVWTRRGLPAGWVSREFSTSELLQFCANSPSSKPVYVEAWSDLRVVCSARLSGEVHSAHAVVERIGGAGAAGVWRVRGLRAARPGKEIRVWACSCACAAGGVWPLSPAACRWDAKFECLVCGDTFLRPNLLRVHTYLECAKPDSYSFWRRLASHADNMCNKRRNDAGHQCPYCGRTYSRRYGLKIHVRTHTGHKPLRCSHCDRAFADPSNLNKHLRLHRDGRRPNTAITLI